MEPSTLQAPSERQDPPLVRPSHPFTSPTCCTVPYATPPISKQPLMTHPDIESDSPTAENDHQEFSKPHPLIHLWLSKLTPAPARTATDHPNYWHDQPSTLQTTSNPHSFHLGTGAHLFESVICPIIEAAEEEVLLVTCFWAASESLELLCRSLRRLSDKAVARGSNRSAGGRRGGGTDGKIAVRIGFSSRSLWQKIFHTQSPAGFTYAASEWPSALGLPGPEDLPGLDITVKSVFVKPFSVMHPKFVVVDRRIVVLPSCNVSWEDWFEGAVVATGDVVDQFVRFWEAFWGPGEEGVGGGKSSSAMGSAGRGRGTGADGGVGGHGYGTGNGNAATALSAATSPPPSGTGTDTNTATLPLSTPLSSTSTPTPTLFLPSPHHTNPLFHPLPCQPPSPPPPTPLNTLLLTLLSTSTRSLYLQTPNLTSPPVLAGILGALDRGVAVHIVTSERLMRLEQCVTAGTTTARCVGALVREWARRSAAEMRKQKRAADADRVGMVEEGRARLGALRVEYYRPRADADAGRSDAEAGVGGNGNGGIERGMGLGMGMGMGTAEREPVQSHLKLTIADDEVVVLGSGNLDRASWYTSQELGVAFFSRPMAETVAKSVDVALKGRKKLVFDSLAG
ncbi:hypothetical protein M8818_004298 [Zalaria obscura]|uniref:Uncharacterized protein n=1 Tax=Zalaria obscura TaxID=2024903 RepID=A0ACC3SCQ5_9PEZI